MKKIFAFLLILALCIAPVISMASSYAHIESVDFTDGLLSGAVTAHGSKCEAVVTMFLPENWYVMISVPIEDGGAFSLFVGALPCECITVAIKDAVTCAVLDAAMLLL